MSMNQIEKSRIAEILELHAEIGGYVSAAMGKAMRLGELLVEQKANMEHGAWTGWVEEHLPFDIRTAQNYMRVFENRDRLKNESVSFLTNAYRLLEEAKPKQGNADLAWWLGVQEEFLDDPHLVVLAGKPKIVHPMVADYEDFAVIAPSDIPYYYWLSFVWQYQKTTGFTVPVPVSCLEDAFKHVGFEYEGAEVFTERCERQSESDSGLEDVQAFIETRREAVGGERMPRWHKRYAANLHPVDLNLDGKRIETYFEKEVRIMMKLANKVLEMTDAIDAMPSGSDRTIAGLQLFLDMFRRNKEYRFGLLLRWIYFCLCEFGRGEKFSAEMQEYEHLAMEELRYLQDLFGRIAEDGYELTVDNVRDVRSWVKKVA